MLGAQGMRVPVLPLATQRCCLALRCSGGCSLYGGFKKLIGTSSFPTGVQKQPFRGTGPPQVHVLVSLGVEDSSVPQDGTWLKLSLGMCGTRTGILAAMLYPPNLVILKLELENCRFPSFRNALLILLAY